VVLYVLMGWMCVVAAGQLARALPAPAIRWLLAGGVVYTVGALVYLAKRPRLWPGRFGYHDLWHCMVLVGSACHFIAVIGYVR
jgi:hemolysin III